MRAPRQRSPRRTTSAAAPDVDVVTLLDAFPGRISVWDGDLRLVHANRRQLDTIGLTLDQLRGRTMPEVIGTLGTRAIDPYVSSALQGNLERWSGETQLLDGSLRDSDYLVAPLRSLGKDGGLVFLTTDATTRVHDASRALAQQAVVDARHEQLRSAATLSRQVADELAAAGEALAGLAADDQPGSTYLEVIGLLSNAIKALRGQLIDLLNEPTPRTSTRLVQPPLILRLEQSVVEESATKPRTEPGREQAATDAAELRTVLLAALDALPCAVTGWTPEFTCTFANPAALDWYDLPAEELVGVAGRDLLGDAVYETSVGYGHLAMEGHPQRFVRAVGTAADEQRWARVEYVGQFRGGVAIGAIAVVNDVTADVEAQRARAEAELRVAELGRRRDLAEQGLDPLLQRLFGLTVTLSAFAPSSARSAEVAGVLNEIAQDLLVLIDGEIFPG